VNDTRVVPSYTGGSTETSAEGKWGVGAAEAREEHDGDIQGDIQYDGDNHEAEGLTEREVQMLALERNWWKYAGAKEQAIRELFDLSATHYYQLLNALIDTEAALAHDPMLVKRLRRLRTSRQRARTARRLSGSA
jgi:hypothetical protein